jgi:hypothetical protein
MTPIEDITSVVIAAVLASESRQRARTSSAQQNFEHAVTHIVQELWKSSAVSPTHEVTIQSGRGQTERSLLRTENTV